MKATFGFNRAFSLFKQEMVRHGLTPYSGIENEFEEFMDRGGYAPMADWEDHQGSLAWLLGLYPTLSELYRSNTTEEVELEAL